MTVTAPTQVFDLLDLVNLVAAAKDWELQFDSGPGDYREVMFHKQDRDGRDVEINVEFDFTGRIERSEKRYNGALYYRYYVEKDFSSADVHIATLRLFG